jgi:hypothetical protein
MSMQLNTLTTPQNLTATGLELPLYKYIRQQKQPVSTSHLENTHPHPCSVPNTIILTADWVPEIYNL